MAITIKEAQVFELKELVKQLNRIIGTIEGVPSAQESKDVSEARGKQAETIRQHMAKRR